MCPNAKQGQTLLAFIEKMKRDYLRSRLCETIGTLYGVAADFFRGEFYGSESATLVRDMLCRYCAGEGITFAELDERDGEEVFEVFRFLDEEAYILDIRSTQDSGASREDPDTLSALGGLYCRGDGVKQDYQRACHFYRLASLGGSSMGQFNLGNMYTNGRGVVQDHRKAATCFRASAEQGNADAQDMLGCAYLFWNGVPQDDSEAARWLLESAKKANVDAQKKIGYLFAVGRGVNRDLVSALMWTQLAAEKDDSEALRNRAVIAGTMSQSDIDKALEKARAWRPELWSMYSRGRYRPMANL